MLRVIIQNVHKSKDLSKWVIPHQINTGYKSDHIIIRIFMKLWYAGKPHGY